MNTTNPNFQDFPSVACLQGGDQVPIAESANARACPTNIESRDGGEHTPGPYFPVQVATGMWEVVISEKPYSPTVAYLSSGAYLPGGTPEGNARFIACACNCYDELLGALTTLVNLHDGLSDGGDGITNFDWSIARAATARATGKEQA